MFSIIHSLEKLINSTLMKTWAILYFAAAKPHISIMLPCCALFLPLGCLTDVHHTLRYLKYLFYLTIDGLSQCQYSLFFKPQERTNTTCSPSFYHLFFRMVLAALWKPLINQTCKDHINIPIYHFISVKESRTESVSRQKKPYRNQKTTIVLFFFLTMLASKLNFSLEKKTLLIWVSLGWVESVILIKLQNNGQWQSDSYEQQARIIWVCFSTSMAKYKLNYWKTPHW